MGILNDFYKIKSTEILDSGSYKAKIILNKNHAIFKGHFPGNPVAPGVCMMQIVKDLTENFLNAPLFLTSASNVKFMAIINPEEHAILDMDLNISEDEENIKVKNTTSFGETIALKMSVSYKKI